MRRNLSLKGRCQSLGEPLRRLRPGTVVTASGTRAASQMRPDWLSEGGDLGIEYCDARVRPMVDWSEPERRTTVFAHNGRFWEIAFLALQFSGTALPSRTQRRARRANSPANAPPPRFLRHKHLHHVGSLKGGQKRLVAHVVVDHRGRRNLAMRPRRESSACPASACQSGLHFEAERISPPSVRQGKTHIPETGQAGIGIDATRNGAQPWRFAIKPASTGRPARHGRDIKVQNSQLIAQQKQARL